MPRYRSWIDRVLKNHPGYRFRNVLAKPKKKVTAPKFSDNTFDFLVKLIRGRHRAEFVELKKRLDLVEATRPPSSELAFLKHSSTAGSEQRSMLFAQHPVAVKEAERYARLLLSRFPDLQKRMLSREVARYDETNGTQITWSNRHAKMDSRLLRVLSQLKVKPRSFLEAGAAFNSRSNGMGMDPLPDWLAPTRQTKDFLTMHSLPVRVVAADIVPISKVDQQLYLKSGISALQWDYRKRPLYGRTGKPEQFGLIRFTNVSRHQSRGEFRQTLRILFQCLEPNGILLIANDLNRSYDEVYYQKKNVRGKWTLVQVASAIPSGHPAYPLELYFEKT